MHSLERFAGPLGFISLLPCINKLPSTPLPILTTSFTAFCVYMGEIPSLINLGHDLTVVPRPSQLQHPRSWSWHRNGAVGAFSSSLGRKDLPFPLKYFLLITTPSCELTTAISKKFFTICFPPKQTVFSWFASILLQRFGGKNASKFTHNNKISISREKGPGATILWPVRLSEQRDDAQREHLQPLSPQ